LLNAIATQSLNFLVIQTGITDLMSLLGTMLSSQKKTWKKKPPLSLQAYKALHHLWGGE